MRLAPLRSLLPALVLIGAEAAAHAGDRVAAAPGPGSQAAAAGLPRIGTRFVPESGPPVQVPIDRRWDQLLASQQALFKRSWYVDMAADDEPPYPADGPAAMLADIVKVQNAASVEGQLFATVMVDAQGQGTEVRFHRIPDPALREVLAFVLLKPRYKPARCNGMPCAMEYPVTASFERRVPAAGATPPTIPAPATR